MEYPLPKVRSYLQPAKLIFNEFFSRFVIKDETGTPVLKIEGPLCPCSCFGSDVEFKVLSTQTGEQVNENYFQKISNIFPMSTKVILSFET